MPPLVSIVTPSFNQVRYLEQALRSVLDQGYPRLEYIVIDGGSTDGSQAVLKRYASRLAHWVSEPDQGQADAINKGLRMARGDVVAWLNSDDAYLPGAISHAVEALEREPEAAMVYADGLMVDAELTLLDRHVYPQLDVLGLLSFDVILQPTVFMRREVVEAVGYLRPEFHLILDHDLWVRIASRHPIRHVPGFWAIERTHQEAKTISQSAGFVEEAQRLLAWATSDPSLAPLVRTHGRRIRGGLEVFAARRLIDAGEYGQAVARLWKAFRLHPPAVIRYWYKVLQAVGSALGLSGLFEAYRRTRRRLTHRRQRVELGPAGPERADFER